MTVDKIGFLVLVPDHNHQRRTKIGSKIALNICRQHCYISDYFRTPDSHKREPHVNDPSSHRSHTFCHCGDVNIDFQSSGHGLWALSCFSGRLLWNCLSRRGGAFCHHFFTLYTLSSCNTLQSGAVVDNSRSPRNLVDNQFGTYLPRQAQVASNGSPKTLWLSSMVSASSIPLRIDPLKPNLEKRRVPRYMRGVRFIPCGEVQASGKGELMGIAGSISKNGESRWWIGHCSSGILKT